ncbi:MAG: formate--phosphoribosylaminoimidazolecarboxamide ligase [Candidatus Methanoperedens sp.]|jgi:5-formaminoimidazole-4-carboxamide-1-(beta)-D-ribofuranosyl 5'-monophosphate synthetase|nr:formate--phosphoribosylaminoimidazolecarboxamide ligase [Candidatus Methanoperedens sp.]PKL54361.1 MAG: 5-formaminoimidazole-4-carboxamide-1-(beta)-D-ribofuranosyl 5'-monophosphate synthetase [Candidatus Methanoperedenaceae archaeon HGW-Methanoperedenaceae-1]
MISKQEILDILEGYDKENLAIATVCSHSSLQIFDGARKEGFRTIGICIGKPPKFYDAFPRAKPDEFFSVKDYKEILTRTDELAAKNAIIIPHGSFVEYLGASNFVNLRLPTFGNRHVLEWESDRDKSREWLEAAGIKMPRQIKNPEDIDSPMMVKYHGAKGGMGFFVVKNYSDFRNRIKPDEKYTIQEFVLGTRYYMHYYYSPITTEGYTLSKGTLKLTGIDRRVESNADEIFRIGSPTELAEAGIYPTFVVTGNQPLIIRESILPRIFEMGEMVVEKSLELFGGMIGPFCLETVVTDHLELKVFEISARIVAGTNLFISGSPYSDLIEENLSTGRIIAREIKEARKVNRLSEVIS